MHRVLFTIGPFTIYSYGLMIALGFIIATMLAVRTAANVNVSQDKVATLSLVILISGIIGARILYILLNLTDFIASPLEMFMVWHGGLVFYGGALLAFVSGLIYLRIAKMPILDTADLISPYIALGHSIGRIGCFLNGCCFGKTTSNIFGVMFSDGVMRYPTQIYSSFYLLFLYMFLRVRLQFRQFTQPLLLTQLPFIGGAGFKGQAFFSYLIFYPAGRFFIEFLRGDNQVVVYNLTFSQLVSLCVFIFGVCGYWLNWRWNKTR